MADSQTEKSTNQDDGYPESSFSSSSSHGQAEGGSNGLTWSFMRARRGIVTLMLTSSKKSPPNSSCSAVLLTAASTLPPEGAGEEWAESAGRGDTLSNLLVLPVLELSASSSSSLDRTTGGGDDSDYCCYY